MDLNFLCLMTGIHNEKLKESIKTINHVIDALGEFEGKYDKKLNLSKLLQHLKIPDEQTSDIISILFNVQIKFATVFKDYFLKAKTENDQVYLFTVKKDQIDLQEFSKKNEKEINLSKAHASLLSDLIYVFKRVKRGKGFDLTKSGTDLIKKVKELKREHPYLFNKNGNGLVYPSGLAVELGNTINTYAKTNKNFNSYSIMNYNIKIIEHD